MHTIVKALILILLPVAAIVLAFAALGRALLQPRPKPVRVGAVRSRLIQEKARKARKAARKARRRSR